VIQKVYQPLYFARENTRTPFYFALVALAVNAAVAIGLAPVTGFIAAALGATLAGWAMAWLLWRGARGMGEAARLDDRFRARLPRILAASAVMGAVLWLAALLLGPALGTPTVRYAALAVLIAIGLGTYALAGRALGAFTMADLRGALRR
jgi:putative peptidoglycan lipid II flippase